MPSDKSILPQRRLTPAEVLERASRTNLTPELLESYDGGKGGRWVHIAKPTYSSGLRGIIVVNVPLENSIPETFPLPLPYLEGAFQISHAEGKGQGMFAIRDISIGEAILVEHPVLVMPNIAGPDLFETAFNALAPAEQRELLKLCNCKPADVCDVKQGIIRTNSLGLVLDAPEGTPDLDRIHSGMFLKLSRCNHSCAPNATYFWDITTFTTTLYSSRPIRSGEEITITYIPNWKSPSAERRDKLKQMYLFDCACSVCSLPAEALAESDKKRALIHDWWQIHASYVDWVCAPSIPDNALIKNYTSIISFMEKEGIRDRTCYRGHVEMVAMCYAALKDLKNFKLWALKAKCACYAGRKEEKKDKIELYRGWFENPRSCSMWGIREAFRTGKTSIFQVKKAVREIDPYS